MIAISNSVSRFKRGQFVDLTSISRLPNCRGQVLKARPFFRDHYFLAVDVDDVRQHLGDDLALASYRVIDGRELCVLAFVAGRDFVACEVDAD